LSRQGLSDATRVSLAWHGLLVMLVGLLGGALHAVVVIGHLELWPLLGRIDWTPAGDAAAWSRTHTGPLMNGLLALAVASVGRLITLGAAQARVLHGSLLVTLWGNTAGYFMAALYGGRGLQFGLSTANTLTYLVFATAAVAVLVAITLALLGLRRHRLHFLEGSTP
jgi:styrene-oxide isomerase